MRFRDVFKTTQHNTHMTAFYSVDLRAPLKTPSEKKQLCTASAASSPLVVRKHAFDGFSCILLFLTQNGFLEVPLRKI